MEELKESIHRNIKIYLDKRKAHELKDEAMFVDDYHLTYMVSFRSTKTSFSCLKAYFPYENPKHACSSNER